MQIFNNTGGFYIKNKSGNNFALFDNDAGALMIGSGVNGNPSATLFVRGSTLTTSWTGINFSSALNVTPTAPLEVSGTISATALLINGQSVTGGVSTFASLTDVSFSAAGFNVFGPGSLSSDLRRRLRWAIDNELTRRGLTIADLARLAGRDRATVSHSLRSARMASLDVLVFYAEALGLRVVISVEVPTAPD